MMLLPISLVVAFASSTLSVPQHDSSQSSALESANALAPGLSSDIIRRAGERLILDEPGDGFTWARGPSWKASFGSDGFTYIPFFGSDAPKNFPVRFDLKHASAGGEEIRLAPRRRSRSGERVSLDRGSLEEVYHVKRDSVEQTFVIASVPGPGDVVLQLDVETDLAPAHTKEGGVEFACDYGEVHYGVATAIDASGQSLVLHQALKDGVLEIVIPGSFMADATMPLVVDPIVTTLTFGSSTRDVTSVDVSCVSGEPAYQIVYAERQSALDSDIVELQFSGGLGMILQVTAIDVTGANWTDPSNASNHQENQFLCVALRGNAFGARQVWGRTKEAVTGGGGQQFQISDSGAESVDVGGKGNFFDSIYDYMVVWQQADNLNADFDIVAQAVRADSTLTNSRITIDGDANDLDRNPCISKSAGHLGSSNADSEYMIVWEREVAPDNRNLRAQVIEYTGSMSGHSQFSAYTFSDSINADVSCRKAHAHTPEPHWLIAFERRVASVYKIFAVIAEDGSANNARNVNAMQDLDVDLEHRSPVIASNFDSYFVGYQTEAANGDYHAYLTALKVVFDGSDLRTGVSSRRELLATSEGAPATLGLASRYDGSTNFGAGAPGDAIFAWSVRDTATDDYDPAAAVVTVHSDNVLGSQFCQAAVNSSGMPGFIMLTGITTSVSPTLRVSDLPANSFGYFLASTQSGFTVNPGGSQGNLCLQGSIGRFTRPGEIQNSGSDGGFHVRVDTSDIPTPNGSVMALPGETWYFQCWFRDVGSTSNFTNGIAVWMD